MTVLAFGGTSSAVVTPPPVNLGSAANASVLSAADPTNTNASTITQDVSSSPNPTGTMPGYVACPGGANCVTYGAGAGPHLHDPTAASQTAAETAAHIATAALPNATAILPGLEGQTLQQGLYSTGAASIASNGTLTLDANNNANSVWVFQVASSLTANVGSNVVFINIPNGATAASLACNVTWTLGSQGTLNGSTFVGTVLATSGVTVGSAVTVNGRLFGGTSGSVTLIGDTINSGNCTVVPPGTTPGGTGATPITGGGLATGGGLGTGGGIATAFTGAATPVVAVPQTAG
ncbi:MAG TPA: ice-binding family protein [Acidimicrobiia bacterium]|nr:ice-binding family protein [Acidimicrobiia bacterium]